MQLRPMIRCREIGVADLDAVADLLTRGFAGRSREYWIGGLRRQAACEVVEGYPRFGYMLDHEGSPVGVLLLLYTARDDGGEISIRCNLSSWYVDPPFRSYAPMLTSIAQRHKQVTYVNITAAPTTWPIIEAQGFRAYCSGLFFSFPALSRAAAGMRVEIISKAAQAIDGLSVNEVALLAHHAAVRRTRAAAHDLRLCPGAGAQPAGRGGDPDGGSRRLLPWLALGEALRTG